MIHEEASLLYQWTVHKKNMLALLPFLNKPPSFSAATIVNPSFCLLFQFLIPSISSPFHVSLFKVQVLNSGGDSSNTDDLSSSVSSSQTASRPQTFLSRVTMATVPPSPQPPQATVRQAVPPFPPQPPLSSPSLGSSAASGRPPQQAPHAEVQDKGTKRGFVPPMTPQPLRIQGAILHGHSHRQALYSQSLTSLPNTTHIAPVKCCMLMNMPVSSHGSSCHNVFRCDEVK